MTSPCPARPAPLLDRAHRRFIRTEMLICMTASAILPPIGMWFTFGPWPMAFWGSAGFAASTAKGTVVMVVLMTALMTLGVRQRMRKGNAPAIVAHPHYRWIRLKPASILLRVPLFALIALAVFCPLGIGVMVTLGYRAFDRLTFCVFNGLYGAVIAAVMTPVILVAALSDPAREARVVSTTDIPT